MSSLIKALRAQQKNQRARMELAEKRYLGGDLSALVTFEKAARAYLITGVTITQWRMNWREKHSRPVVTHRSL